jgi:hypothetical protein
MHRILEIGLMDKQGFFAARLCGACERTVTMTIGASTLGKKINAGKKDKNE